MEPFTTAALAAAITALVNGAAGEAGKSTWTSLKDFVSTRWGHDSEPATALAAVEAAPDDREAVHALAGTLHNAADREGDTAAWLGGWLDQARTVANASGTVHNTIGGTAHVHGTVIQGYQFNGDINLR